MPHQPSKHDNLIFRSRKRLRHWRAIAGIFHLLTVCLFTFALAKVLPGLLSHTSSQARQISSSLKDRQDLIETMDRIVRYQNYFRERNGRYTRDLGRLGLPDQLASGTSIFEVFRHYEISMLEAESHRFVLLARGVNSTDRATVDEKSRLRANFNLPPLSRAYLMEEAERILSLKNNGENTSLGLSESYWNIRRDENGSWLALGDKDPVRGERLVSQQDEQGLSLFSSVRGHMEARISSETNRGSRTLSSIPEKLGLGFKKEVKELSAKEAVAFLERVQSAQWIHKRERGRFAVRWEDLQLVSKFDFNSVRAAKNVRLLPLEVSPKGFRIILEGTEGDLLGEQFVASDEGAVRQVRYTEALAEQLQQTTDLLGSFQINPVGEGKKSLLEASP